MKEFLNENFAPGPVFGWLCIATLLMIPIVWIQFRRNRASVPVRYSSCALVGAVGSSWAVYARYVPPVLRTLALIAITIAMARPQSRGAYQDSSEGIAIQMLLDISGSMQQEDFLLDGMCVRRLDAVKNVFRDFVLGKEELQGREQDLVGMTTFAMFAESACPLTLDHATLSNLLKETDIPGWVDGRMMREDEEANYTSIADAITLATDDLRRAGDQAVAGVPGTESAKSRVMILLTDGADNPPKFRNVDQPPNPLEAAKVAARFGIKIYTIGAVGSGRCQTRRGFFGNRGMAVDERSLKQIAETTGGQYFRATDAESLGTIYDEIDKLERRKTGERSFKDNIYAARIAMLVALGLLGTELLLVNTRLRRVP